MGYDVVHGRVVCMGCENEMNCCMHRGAPTPTEFWCACEGTACCYALPCCVVSDDAYAQEVNGQGGGDVGAAVRPRRGVDYDVFVDVLQDAELSDLACREVFSLFDIGNKGQWVT